MSGPARWAVRGLAALAVLLGLAAGALTMALPRIAASDSTRARIQAASRDALGRELDYASLEVGLLPPSLQMVAPVLAGEREGAPPLARAERVGLRAALWPLLRGHLEVRSVVAEGLDLRLVRTRDELDLPEAPGRGAPPAGEAPESEGGGEGGAPGAPSAPDEGSKLAVEIRRVLVRDGAVTIEDRSVSPAVTWELRDLQLDGRPRGAGVELDGSTVLGSGGGLEVEGRVVPDGEIDLALELDEVGLAALGPYLGERLGGALSGQLRVRGETADPELAAELRAQDAAWGDTRLRGPAEISAELERALSGPRGPFRVDLGRAAFEAGGFQKPAGTQAVLSGRVVEAGGALGVDDLALDVHNLRARGQLRTAPKTTLQLSAESFDLGGWDELVPALSPAALRGRLAVPELTVTTGPLAARGLVRLEQWVSSPPGREPIALDGALELLGTSLRSRDLAVSAAGQPFQVQARVDSLFDGPRYRVDFESAGAEANALLAAFAGQPDRLYGPLVGSGHLAGALGGEQGFLDALQGDVQFAIDGGRIVGTPILQAMLGPAGARLAEWARGRGDLERFYSEQFERLGGALQVAGGQILARPISLDYRGYGVRLEGPIALADLSLDLRGSMTVNEGLDAELAKVFGAGSDYQPRQRTLEITSVRGKLGAPKVQLAGSSIEQLAAAYATDVQTDQLRKKLEEELGPGTAPIVDQGIRALEGLLGREPRAPEAETPAPEEADEQPGSE